MSTEIMHELTVIEKTQETSDTATFTLQIPADKKTLFYYKPGQFLTVFMTIDNKSVARSYSFSSCPMGDPHLSITVKRVPGGIGSNYLLDHVHSGGKLLVSPPAGHFFNMGQSAEDELEYYLFAAGSGVTPLFSVIKWTLPSLPKHKIHLIYSNKTHDSTIFLNSLKDLEKKYPQLKVTYFYSQLEEPHQRLTADNLKQILSEAFSTPTKKSFYLCGPEAYMQTIENELNTHDVDPAWVHKESFFAPEGQGEGFKSKAQEKGIYIETLPDGFKPEACEQITADIDGETIVVDLKNETEESILETLLDAGHTPPFSCMSGSCQVCMCTLIEGEVFQENEGVLTQEDIDDKKFLACQAKAVSKKLKIVFDED